jgi:CRISPR-associated protein (TIGR03986 family)
MNPKHIDQVPADRRAIAPYNFVELPDKVVEAQELPSGDRYHPNKDVELPRHTGRIECTLTTESLLYTRSGWSPEDFSEYGEQAFNKLPDDIKNKRANFFANPATQKQIIPGSSLRGMLRTLVEIVSFGKIDRVSGQQHFFFRAVAADKDDPLKEEYKKYVKPQNIKAGYLEQKQDSWFIRPAMPIDKDPFVWVKEDKLRSISELIPMSNLSEYRPQYFINISFGDIHTKNSRHFAGKVSSICTQYQYKGVVVTSGNMLEGGTNPDDLTRKNHCIVREPDSKAQLIPICEDAIQDYFSALTSFQKKEPPFDENNGVLKKGRCIFYCQPQAGQPVTLFGQSPNFRIPYSPQGDGKASTARDFVPDFLKDSQDKLVITDVAEAIFGFVRGDKQAEGRAQSRGGRVFISDGILNSNQEQQVRESQNQEPEEILLSNPKPTTFQHYLVQKKADKIQLKHYASQPPSDTEVGETVIRGHKLYWHKPAKIEVPDDTSDTQTSLIKPINLGIEFTFTIHFENLSQFELGALLWVLSLGSNKSQTLETGKEGEKYCFSLGMGKPFGMGAVKIDYELLLGDRTSRYTRLFDGSHWNIGDREKEECTDVEKKCVKAFEKYILDGISDRDYPKDRNREQLHHLKQLPRIEMLLAMLRCNKTPEVEDTRYMTIDAKEYQNRPVLPTPLQVAGIEDNRRLNNPVSPGVKKKDNVVKSERQVEITKVVRSQKFTVEQILDAIVTSINGNKVTYQILEVLKLTEKEPKKAALLQVGQVVRVKITALKEDGSIKSVKYVD